MDAAIDSVNSSSLAVADVDGDNDQDVIIIGRDLLFLPITKLYLNDGMFSSARASLLQVPLDFTLFPNPTSSDGLKVKLESRAPGWVHLQLYHLSGQLLQEQKEWIPQGEANLSVDLSALASGSYFLQVEMEGRRGSRKVMVR